MHGILPTHIKQTMHTHARANILECAIRPFAKKFNLNFKKFTILLFCVRVYVKMK